MVKDFEFDSVEAKAAAAGRWPEILTAIGGLSPSCLDGGHHPCPKCGGKDRFRLIDEAAGAVLCNQCFSSRNGDGLAALMWCRGWDFKTALRELSQHLGIKPNETLRLDQLDNRQVPDVDGRGAAMAAWWMANRPGKPGILPKACLAARARSDRWMSHPVVTFDAYLPTDWTKPVAVLLYRNDGKDFPKVDGKNGKKPLSARKVHTLAGSHDGLIPVGTPAEFAAAHTAWLCEGPPDALCLHQYLPAGEIAVTSALGAKSFPEELASAFLGKRVHVMKDSDRDGGKGAALRLRMLDQVATEVRIIDLPPGRGKDVRDFLTTGGGTFAELQTLVDQAQPEKTPAPASPAGGMLSLEPPEGRTDKANAVRFVASYGSIARYCDVWRKWLIWDGRRWKIDDVRRIELLAKSVGEEMWAEVAELVKAKSDNLDGAIAHARYTNNLKGILNLIAVARSEEDVPIVPAELDGNPWALNVMNGTVDLRTGDLFEHDASNQITKLCPVEYDPDATCPTWLRFLTEIMAGDQSLVSFLQRAAGHSLTGDVSEQAIFFCYGNGANGKSTFLGCLQGILGGDYSMKAAPDLLVSKRGNRHPTEVADLAGKRLVACIEADDGARLAESLLKELTGGDNVRARRMKEDFWEFPPTHKIWLAANHKPAVRGTDYGIWRRIKMIPFAVKFDDAHRDRTLPDKLREEYPGILNWAVDGCLAWQRDGLGEPAAVRKATAEYKSESDVIGQFLTECVDIGDAYRSLARDLYGAYKNWAERGSEIIFNQTKFGQEIFSRGFERYTNNGTWYRGLQLQQVERTQGHDTIEIPWNQS